MADALHLSVRTIEAYRASLQQKLGLRSRAELVRVARESGLVEKPLAVSRRTPSALPRPAPQLEPGDGSGASVFSPKHDAARFGPPHS